MWFLNKFKSVVPDDPGLVFLSDRNPSLIKSVQAVFPLSNHGYCIQHLSQNVKANIYYVNKDTCVKKFKECAHAYTESEFLTLYGAFRTKYPVAAEYLDVSVSVDKWARCYLPGERYNIDTSNIVESINGVLRKARKYALLPMIDVIVEKVAEWFNKHRNSSAEVSSGQKLVPYVEKEIHKRSPEAKKLVVHELNAFFLEYMVIGKDGKSYLVDMNRKTCSCKLVFISPDYVTKDGRTQENRFPSVGELQGRGTGRGRGRGRGGVWEYLDAGRAARDAASAARAAAGEDGASSAADAAGETV